MFRSILATALLTTAVPTASAAADACAPPPGISHADTRVAGRAVGPGTAADEPGEPVAYRGAPPMGERHLGADQTQVIRALATEVARHRGALVDAARLTGAASAWLPPPPFPGIGLLRFELNVLGITTTIDELRRLREAAEKAGVRVAGLTGVGGITVGEPGGTVERRGVQAPSRVS